jgi:prepilin-type N-terminal cleavage/methylation domain-containing protein
MKYSQSQAGFTLIELLVVTSIISLMASTVLVAMVNTRKNARDVVRKQSLSQLQKALESYYSDFGQYPTNGWAWYSSDPADNSSIVSSPTNYIPGLVPNYIGQLPKDPRGGASENPICGTSWKKAYIYLSDGRDYKLISHCATENLLPTDPMVDAFRDGGPPPSDYFNGSSCNGVGDFSSMWGISVYSSARSRCW